MRNGWFWYAMTLIFAAESMDMMTTILGINHGYTEMNPLGYWWISHGGVFALSVFKAVATVGICWLFAKMWEFWHGPYGRTILIVVVHVLMIPIALINIRTFLST